MKRIFALLLIGLSLNGCDDGDLIFDEFDFEDVSVARCPNVATGVTSNILYKINNPEILILQIPNLETVLPDTPTPAEGLDPISIDGTNIRVVYRLYNGDATAANICDAIQPPTPAVTEEWNAIAGMIYITTTAIITPNTADGFTGGETISKLRHAIKLKNITFQTPNNQIRRDSLAFGNYDSAFDAPTLNIGGTPAVCDLASPSPYDLLYKVAAATAITINIDPALLDETILGTPKTGVISGEMNRVTYREYAIGTDLSALTNFCTEFPALTPTETWISQDGVVGVSGIVEVTTTTLGSGVTHTIKLKNVRLQNSAGNLSFKIADDYEFGELIVN
ncbi:MAG: hypothetical protein EOO50_04795 [Flavobacterium sp.]|uniref:hypothetical protein n=1 Tax=Flavobacterium sp. TaxID=239 RepID=UPI00120F96F5|nr:hypothetical protein [Flavobacterium sp.]RZJ67601.1 MAG: hypothetical protein EOO50_04795 [Flavobacterium sp.]